MYKYIFANHYTILGGKNVIRPCAPTDFETVYEIVNDDAAAYRGVITPRSVEGALHAAIGNSRMR